MRLRALLAVLVGLLLGPWAPTTSASAATYTYDVPTVERVGVHTFGVAEANPPQLSVAWERSASPSVEARGVSSTPIPGVVATESVDLYRGMKPGGAGLPEVGPSAKTLGVRPGTDIPVDAHGMVHPGTGGMSVNTSPTGMPEFRRPPSFGGSAKDVDMFCIQSCDLGPSLRFRADPGSAGHGFVEPVRPMTIGEYQQALAGTQGQWGGVEP